MLPPLLDSILSQDYRDYEILILEDASPERIRIRTVVEEYQARYPGRIRYHENSVNLGYDGNLRALIGQARGEFCFFMGNDDLMFPGALESAAAGLNRHPTVGVVLRTYAWFEPGGGHADVFRYFDGERFFPRGARTIAAFFRRCVVIPGMVVHTDTARRHATDRFDGSTLYQLHLVAHILAERDGLALPEVLVLYRRGGVPDFGRSSAERGKFVPGARTPESSLFFVREMVRIAREAERSTGLAILDAIRRDIANYAYPILALHADKPRPEFRRYVRGLAAMGIACTALFWAYVALLLVVPTAQLERWILAVNRAKTHVPRLGRVYRGEPVP